MNRSGSGSPKFTPPNARLMNRLAGTLSVERRAAYRCSHPDRHPEIRAFPARASQDAQP
ncbi:hypothetical protein [Methanoculleus chikugoensis]|uniref:hypothetical protein n=1 Tax=Methanoculleus chikugoensis TaxID=118126 RepID=UPI001FB21CD2|nr:hypothetical protein [Methanoculleus chikugoensis]